MKLLFASSAFIKTFPSLSAKNPLVVRSVRFASPNVPTLILPPESKVTFPPVSVEAPIVQPPISPLPAVTEPLITTSPPFK